MNSVNLLVPAHIKDSVVHLRDDSPSIGLAHCTSYSTSVVTILVQPSGTCTFEESLRAFVH